MLDAGAAEEARAALAEDLSPTARRVIGLEEVGTLPREQAIEAVTVRTRRYAAYQRKWMRRLEGLVMVAADRPPEEVAAEIVALARARERLSRR
jgi:tRNA A37 N6-isopentenylltransferase MiaA